MQVDRCPVCGRPKRPTYVACPGCAYATSGPFIVRPGASFVVPVAAPVDTPAQAERRARTIAAAWARLRASRESYGER